MYMKTMVIEVQIHASHKKFCKMSCPVGNAHTHTKPKQVQMKNASINFGYALRTRTRTSM